MTAKKSILVIDNSTGWTGAFKSIVTVAQHLSRNYHFHFCIPRESANAQYLSQKRIPHCELNFIELSKRITTLFYLPQLLLNSFRIRAYCKSNNIEVIHVNDIYNLTGIIVKFVYPKVKLIYHIRLLESSYARVLYKTWIRVIARHADHLVAVSQAAHTDATRYTKQPVGIIHDCVESSPVLNKTRTSASVTFLYLANYIPGKGHDVAIKSFATAYRQNSGIKMIMAGGDLGVSANKVYKRSLAELLSRQEVSEVVELRGFEPDIRKAMSECDVFLNFSASESFSMTCLEAIMNGKPVIATASGGPAEIVKHDYCGIIIPVGDVNAAAEAMLQLAGDGYKRDYFGKNALLRAGEKFNLEKEAFKLSEFYDA
jgi:L-malate glycosyltransferase